MIQKLRTTGTQWEELVFDKDREGDEEIIVSIQRLVKILRQELKEGDEEEVRRYLQKEQLQQDTIDALVSQAEEMLSFYKAFALFRELENKDVEVLRGWLSAIYQKYIIRYEPGYLNRMAIGKFDLNQVNDIADRMYYLTDYYVSRSYNLSGMARDLQDETGLSAEICMYWAEIIDQNYQTLKMNFILEELKEFRKIKES